MKKRLLIIGAGFAGTYAALSAARLRDLQGVPAKDLEISVVAPMPQLVIRPRLYEEKPETLTAPLLDLFQAIDVQYVQASAETIDHGTGSVDIVDQKGRRTKLAFDRLVLAAGSHGFRPHIPGLAEHAFGVDQLDEAVTLDRHLHALAKLPVSKARNTVVVAGGGFTGIETATEMPARLRKILGSDAEIRVIIVERGDAIAPTMGKNPRPIIVKALEQVGVEAKYGVGISAVDAGGATLSSGERLEAATVVWAAGMRATPLAGQLPGEHDNLGRLLVDRDLRVPGATNVFATGDAAKAATDDIGNFTVMSCQHAIRLGAFAGNNAAADLLGVPTEPYHQKAYVTCLDLGSAGAVFTRGWDPQVELTGEKGKAYKREINTVWIYPPRPDRATALAAAEPRRVIDL